MVLLSLSSTSNVGWWTERELRKRKGLECNMCDTYGSNTFCPVFSHRFSATRCRSGVFLLLPSRARSRHPQSRPRRLRTQSASGWFNLPPRIIILTGITPTMTTPIALSALSRGPSLTDYHPQHSHAEARAPHGHIKSSDRSQHVDFKTRIKTIDHRDNALQTITPYANVEDHHTRLKGFQDPPVPAPTPLMSFVQEPLIPGSSSLSTLDSRLQFPPL